MNSRMVSLAVLRPGFGFKSFAFCLLAFMVWGSAVCFAQADCAREQRWADEITSAILLGDPVHLELKSGRKFLAIYTPNQKAVAGVILVHGLGTHPDCKLMSPLRSLLAEQGYATLSVQMPLLAADASSDQYPPLFPEAAERLQTAVAFLRGQGHGKIAIVSHSQGSRMTNFFLNTIAQPQVDAWVAIGIPGLFTAPESFKAPVLDLFGENDTPIVLDNAGKRSDALRRVRGSAQIQVGSADHFFNGREAELVMQVRQFLDQTLR